MEELNTMAKERFASRIATAWVALAVETMNALVSLDQVIGHDHQ